MQVLNLEQLEGVVGGLQSTFQKRRSSEVRKNGDSVTEME
jgi:hypothetical protein